MAVGVVIEIRKPSPIPKGKIKQTKNCIQKRQLCKALEELRSQVSATRQLDFHDPRVQAWRRKFRATLVEAFGDGSDFVTDYDKIAWRTSDRPEDAGEQHALYLRSWAAAEGLLEAAIDRLCS